MIKWLCALLISEILFNPGPSGADYVELYNNSADSLSLSDIRLAKYSDGAITKLYKISDSYIVAPYDYVVITTDAQYITSNFNVRFPEKIIEVSSMPSYPNDGGVVAVATADSAILDMFAYSKKMHSPLLRDVEDVSLERRSFDSPAQSSGNWFSAASTTAREGAAGLGTPTDKNSQSKEFLFVEDDFTVNPSIFSPDGDGYNDLVDITFQLSESDLSANISIFDSRGRLVRHLLRNGVLGSQGTIAWDGLDNDGRRCPRGNYNIVIEAFNTLGTKQISKKYVTLVIK